MNESAINQVLNNYVRDNLSPRPEHRSYISIKYGLLCQLLGASNCYQVGSYARYTAINPVHDLDIIYVVRDATVKANPYRFMETLCRTIKDEKIPGVKDVQTQTHSVTIIFEDGDSDFSIDVVPALELAQRNNYGEPMYEVPEILKLNHHNRVRRYQTAGTQPIKWIKTDPHGYIHAASDLNNDNPNFRHAAKFGKGWRHACKMIYGDDFKLKSFHFEQMFFYYFANHPKATTLEAVTACFGSIPVALERPQFQDRADRGIYIDSYIRELTPTQKSLINRLQADAYTIILRLPGSTSEDVLKESIDTIMRIEKPVVSTSTTVVTQARQPWAY